jgi:hypothetical protein
MPLALLRSAISALIRIPTVPDVKVAREPRGELSHVPGPLPGPVRALVSFGVRSRSCSCSACWRSSRSQPTRVPTFEEFAPRGRRWDLVGRSFEFGKMAGRTSALHVLPRTTCFLGAASHEARLPGRAGSSERERWRRAGACGTSLFHAGSRRGASTGVRPHCPARDRVAMMEKPFPPVRGPNPRRGPEEAMPRRSSEMKAEDVWLDSYAA